MEVGLSHPPLNPSSIERTGEPVSRISANMILTALVFALLQTEGAAAASEEMNVYQTPPFIIKRIGQDLSKEIKCSHGIKDYDVILWYKQSRGGTMELLGYLNQKFAVPEDGWKGKVDFTGDGRQESYLTVAELRSIDSAVYFCAASTALRIGSPVVTKPPRLSGFNIKTDTCGIRLHRWRSTTTTARTSCCGTAGAEATCPSSWSGNEPVYRWNRTGLEIRREDTQRGSLSIPSVRVSDTEPGREPKPPEVTLLPPSPKECHNQKDKHRQKKTLVCAATGFFPDHAVLTWQVDGQDVRTGVAQDGDALPDGDFYKKSSRLRVEGDLWSTPGRAFTCTVSFFDGKNTTLHSKTVYGVLGEKRTRVGYLRSTQSAKLSYVVLLVKSGVYAAFVGFMVWKRRVGTSKPVKTRNVRHLWILPNC
ncbi:uncharacterized protein LOC133513516 [Syngnathoides biaculeatus]|uniref:uncharacterized protein LOC133513516 n=1 Tax=Syngnathoides biaculeatus TaxID=300417 RepID=UPI002ADDE8E1|nr:uncharacterized protein LOC133513516 [Syngnathoides biaculeatus]